MCNIDKKVIRKSAKINLTKAKECDIIIKLSHESEVERIKREDGRNGSSARSFHIKFT